MFPKDQRRFPLKKICFAVLALSMVPSALANNVPACSDNRTITTTTTQYVTKVTTVYSLQTSTSVETISSSIETETIVPTSTSLTPPSTEAPSTSDSLQTSTLVETTSSSIETETIIPTDTSPVPPTTEAPSTTREVITITTVPPAVESTVYVNNCTTVPPTNTATIKPPIPSPTGCVYPSPNRECTALAAPKKLDVYAALLDGCSIVPPRNTSTKWVGVARAYFNRSNGVFHLDLEYSPSLVNVTGVTIARARTTALAPKLLRLKLSTPRWKPAQQIISTSVTLSTAPVRLSPSAAEALYNGLLYVTVNTDRRPVGAIRGQLYCAGPKCAPDATGIVTTPNYPKFIPTSCNPKNPYARVLSRQKCFACI